MTAHTAQTPAAGVAPRAGRREWIGLAVLALPALLVSIDVFVLLLALPHLSADLGVDSTAQLWITDIYGFMVAGFLITMGTLGDRIGRRKLLLCGAAAFGAASVLAAFAASAAMLIAARALLGIAGATLAPSTLALISNMFRDPRQRSLAIGVWMISFIGGSALGPLVGGVMLERFWWGSVFLIGVPAMLLLLVLGPILLPEYRDPDAGRLDLASVALSLLAILPIIYGLKETAKHGWAPLPVAAGLFGAAVGVAFLRRQRALDDPLLDLRLFANHAFSGVLASMFCSTMLLGATMVFITQYLQLVAGLSPLHAGLWMLPAMAGSIATFVLSPLAARRVRPAYLIGGGLAIAVTGLLAISQAGATGGLVTVVAGFALLNFGAGPLMTLGTDLVVGIVPPAKAGSAASVSETSLEFGFALGIAVMGSLGTVIYRREIAGTLPANLPAPATAAARDTLAGAAVAAQSLPDQLGAALLVPARAAFTTGLHTVAMLSAILMIGVAMLAVTLLRHIGPSVAAPTEEQDRAMAAVGAD